MPILIEFRDTGGINGNHGTLALDLESTQVVAQALLDNGYEVTLRGLAS